MNPRVVPLPSPWSCDDDDVIVVLQKVDSMFFSPQVFIFLSHEG